MPDLLSVEDAVARIRAHFSPLPAETVDLAAALGRVLIEDVYADFSAPPFANSSMDGYAVRAADTDAGARLQVVLDIPAGAPLPDRALQPGEAARIMTGAPMPPGADAVVPVEQTDPPWRSGSTEPPPAMVQIMRGVTAGAYVRAIGEDFADRQLILRAGRKIRPAEIGILAALGRARIAVRRLPRVVILSTGDELLEVDQPLEPGRIRDANGHALAALVTQAGGIAIRLPIARDTLDDVRARFREALALTPDLILSSAGVSVGAFDVVRAVIDELGAIDFWRVNVRPGKPLAVGQIGGVPFIGLPGNPVSAMVTFELFVRPALAALSSQPDDVPTIEAILGEPITSDGRRSYLRVTLERDGGKWIALTTGTQSSGALLSMVLADGLLIVPEGVTRAEAGERFTVRLLS